MCVCVSVGVGVVWGGEGARSGLYVFVSVFSLTTVLVDWAQKSKLLASACH